jgi:XTP/dITP diphosphohydrolase
MEEIIIASGNKGKIKEAQEILSEYKIIPIKEIGIDIDVEEDKETFEENAIKKASEISKYLKGRKCISDDSGIEIEYLNGFPGVFTKRWHAGSDRDRNLEIINKLKDVPKERRKVKWISAIALAEGKNIITAVAYIEGYIAENVRGDNGFGFDEIFELENGKTLAELTSEEKNEISARKKALELLKSKLANIQFFV